LRRKEVRIGPPLTLKDGDLEAVPGKQVRKVSFHLPSKTATLRLFLGRQVREILHLPSKTATLRLFLGRLVSRLFLRSTDWRFWRPPKIPEPKSVMRFPFRFTTSRESCQTK
jgi:hypothetical protein